MKVDLIAIKGIRGKSPGESFQERRHIARALVAVGRASYDTRDMRDYHTRDMRAEPPAPPVRQPQTPETKEVTASDAVKQYAQENGIDITEVAGSGKDGRVLRRDIDALIPESPEVTE
jgi:pyruvate/2-oxoglutarate dehydrogenase complex dihydrolipoamide acyltransferase (E2) component